MKNKIIVCQGLPASGKSKWAKDFVKNNKGWLRINNDEFRYMFFNRQFDKGDTNFIDEARDLLIEHFMKYNLTSLIVDNTNLSPKRIKEYQDLAMGYGYDFEVKSFTDVPLKLCIERDKYRENSVGEKVIRQMYNQFLKKEPVRVEFDPNKIPALICDVDGSLAYHNPILRSPYQDDLAGSDTVNEAVANVVRLYHECGTKILICSGREYGRGYEVLKKWLYDNNIPWDKIFMRQTGDIRKDSIVKAEIYENEIKEKYAIRFVLDDRDQVIEYWRSIGLPTFQVNYGDF